MAELTPITYDWLLANGWRRLERLERQPHDIVSRSIATECIGTRIMVASEDLRLDLTPACIDDDWHCWVTSSVSPNRSPQRWIGVRFLRYTEEVIALYEALTGRQFSAGHWDQRKLGPSLFEERANG